MGKSKYQYANRATKYARQVVAGKVAACRLVQLACRRHLADLDRKELFWDKDAAEKVCRFISLMVHVNGEWAKRREKIKLEDWQCFIFCSLMGWKWNDSRYRKYTRAYIEIPRKNAKSTSAAGLGLYMLVGDGETGAEIYSGATSEKQAMHVFSPAWKMVRNNPDFRNHYDLKLGGTISNHGPIYRIEDGARFDAVVHKPGDGASPHCGIVDEYHEHNSSDLFDTFDTGMGARRQPLLLVITTAGKNTSSSCYALRKQCIDAIEGTVKSENTFCLIYTIDETDDWQDFSCWKKANPNFGVSVHEKFLREQYQTALNYPGKRNDALCKHLNVWSNAGQSAFDMAAWERCAAPGLEFEDFAGCRAFVGVDLASKVDIAAMSFFIDGPDGWVVMAKHYLPEFTVSKPENGQYRQFAADGWLTVTEGVRTDFQTVEQDLREASEVLDIKMLGYDPREATYLTTQIAEWADFDLIEVNQGPAQMSEPMKELEALIAAKELQHNGDALLTWQMGNTVKKQGRTGPVKSYYPTKESNENKIDAAVALIMAVKMAHVETEEEAEGYLDVLS